MGKIIDVRAPAAWAATTTTATFAGEGLQLAQSIGWRCGANDTPKWGFVNYGAGTCLCAAEWKKQHSLLVILLAEQNHQQEKKSTLLPQVV